MPVTIGPKRPRRVYLRQWRKYKQLTQQQVADRVGASKATISRWENESRGSLEAYAEAIGEPVERLYTHPPPLEPQTAPEPVSGLPKNFRALVAEAVAEVLRRNRRN